MLTKDLILVAALGAPIVGEPAQQTAPSASAAASTEQAKPAEPKKVCVTEAQLGSHFKKRICATPEEWERRRERDAAEMSKMSDRAATQ